LKREENPLYRWRKKNRKTRYEGQLRDLAGMMGVEYGALAESWTGWMQT